jgi:drug/metabolite transporter (DMT)-like permease
VLSSTTARLALLATVWGSSFLWIKLALRGLSPVEVTLARLLLGATVLFVIVAVRRHPLPRRDRAHPDRGGPHPEERQETGVDLQRNRNARLAGSGWSARVSGRAAGLLACVPVRPQPAVVLGEQQRRLRRMN